VLELQGSESDHVILEESKELNRGARCGLTIDEIGADTMEIFNACDESVTPDGGESLPALKNHVLQARDTILEL
jgi:broad specificity phosphatase PhoE